jgi:hypothetical protein
MDVSGRSASRTGRFISCAHFIGGWLSPAAGLVAVEKRRNPCSYQESNSGRPAHSCHCIGLRNAQWYSHHSPVRMWFLAHGVLGTIGWGKMKFHLVMINYIRIRNVSRRSSCFCTVWKGTKFVLTSCGRFSPISVTVSYSLRVNITVTAWPCHEAFSNKQHFQVSDTVGICDNPEPEVGQREDDPLQNFLSCGQHSVHFGLPPPTIVPPKLKANTTIWGRSATATILWRITPHCPVDTCQNELQEMHPRQVWPWQSSLHRRSV